MILIEHLAGADAGPAGETLRLTFEARCKSRLRTRLVSGEECGLFLPRGTVLRAGERLRANDGRIVAVEAAPEILMEARAADAQQLARAAYHLGNRHIALQVLADSLRFLHDHVLGEMVRGLGLPVSELTAPFEPESGAYGAHGAHGGHGHSADGEGRGPRIHDHFGNRP
jgi:urease accessory protein